MVLVTMGCDVVEGKVREKRGEESWALNVAARDRQCGAWHRNQIRLRLRVCTLIFQAGALFSAPADLIREARYRLAGKGAGMWQPAPPSRLPKHGADASCRRPTADSLHWC